MKTLGLIGGIGPESTIEYYRLLVAGYRDLADGNYPPVIINSVNLQQLLDWMAVNKLDDVTTYLVEEIEKLIRAGADFGALASNTPHIVFDEIQRRTSLRLISIVEATCEMAKSLGLNTVALFGTRYTMQGDFYPRVFSTSGISLVVPNEEQQKFIHEKYMNELLKNVFLPETRNSLLAIADELQGKNNIDGVILGGTELPLILKDESRNGIRFLDTSHIHVQRLLREMTS